MKRIIVFILIVALSAFVFSACSSNESNLGSFSTEKTESYDHTYYAEQTFADAKDVVTVYNSETAAEVF
ncbi:MAG: hypothetical protein IKX92_02005, partial [Clostridia bacterium]|nr:hypothetical protein [Clostridia bacterium]